MEKAGMAAWATTKLAAPVTLHGLTALYEPDRPARATLVAVHGLGGHPVRTWTDTSTNFCWLRDALPHNLPECRVLTFGYDGSLRFASGDPLGAAAADLLAHLQLYLEKLPDLESPAPFIFVAHSIGGLVVKQALVRSAQSVVPTVHKNTAAILFFGTPHASSSISESSRILAKVTTAVLPGTTRLNDVLSLRMNGERTSYINEGFWHVAQTYDISCFYETIPTRAAMAIVVTKQDATLTLPGSRNFALQATHNMLTKFSSPEDMSYVLTLSVLNRVVHDLVPVRPLSRRPPPAKRILDPAAAIPESRRIEFKGFIDLFRNGALDPRGDSHSISDIQEQGPNALLQKSDDTSAVAAPIDSSDSLVFWVHVPLNNTAWVNPCLTRIMDDLPVDLAITEEKYWLSHERKSHENLPHSRHFEPSFFLKADKSSSQMVFYLPYLHWDLLGAFRRRSEYFKDVYSGRSPGLPPGLPERAKGLYQVMRDDPNLASSIHPRRSLDQFFYSNLLDTQKRDDDQVVSKNTRDSRGGTKMIMVDQLWLWLVRTENKATGPSKCAVFTCFPKKEQELETSDDEDLLAIADLRQAIIDELEGDVSAVNGADFVGVLIERAVNVMLQVRNEQSLDFLDVFRGAIAKLTEDQASFFYEFQSGLDAKSEKVGDPKSKREEVKCVLELADIIDELNSVRRVFEAQEDVLRTAIRMLKNHRGFSSSVGTLEEVVNQDINGYMKQVDRLTRDAQRTKDAVMSLLDLQQKEDSLKEAIFSNDQALAAQEQAEETEAQSQILFLFTIVTIVFLPLSFFTSYFGMNVVEFTGEADNTNQAEVWKVMGPISAAIIIGLLTAAFFMYKQTRTQLRKKRKARKREKRESAAEAAAETA